MSETKAIQKEEASTTASSSSSTPGNSFTPRAIDEMNYYVYALVNPDDKKIFYIGKGTGNRVFDHARNAAVEENEATEKIQTIRDIISQGKEVEYYILRHGLEEEVAFEVESAFIDFLTYPSFNLEKVLAGQIAGHHKWNRGIKTVEEINQFYSVHPFQADPNDSILFINLNKSYKTAPTLYEAAKGDWVCSLPRVKKVTHVLVHYHGVVRGVFRPLKWEKTSDGKRVRFEGEEITDSPYLYADIRPLNLAKRRATHYLNA